MKIIIINGPNLNLLGKRETDIYGRKSMDDCLREIRAKYPQIEIEYYQSNLEGELINQMQAVGFDYDGIVLNAGAYTHTSIALLDCIKAIPKPVIEVHISNTQKREDFRRVSIIAQGCLGTIQGFGLNGYRLAVEALLLHIGKKAI